MSGYGWNSGAGSSSGYNSNPIPIRCEICNRVLFGTEAFLSHYETHILTDSFTLRPVRDIPTFQSSFQNNFHLQHQPSQSSLVLAPCRDHWYGTIPAPPTPPAPQPRQIRSAYPAMQQQMDQPPMQIQRRGNENPLNFYYARPIPAPVNQRVLVNQPAPVNQPALVNQLPAPVNHPALVNQLPAPVNHPALVNHLPAPMNQPAPDVIDLVDSDEDSESSDGSNNELDLTLSL